jgi:hypothetical protein
MDLVPSHTQFEVKIACLISEKKTCWNKPGIDKIVFDFSAP